MSGYVVSPKADEDIFEICRYLHEQAGIDVATRVEAEIYGASRRSPKIRGLGISVPI